MIFFLKQFMVFYSLWFIYFEKLSLQKTDFLSSHFLVLVYLCSHMWERALDQKPLC